MQNLKQRSGEGLHVFTKSTFKKRAQRSKCLVRPHIAFAAISAAGALFSGQSLHAATDTWVGSSTANFNAVNGFNVVPSSGDSLTFGVAGTTGTTLSDNLFTPAAYNISGITFNSSAAAYTINAATAGTNGFTLTGNITNSGIALETINDSIVTTAARTITMTTGGGNILLGGNISGTAGGITTAGAGTLTLSGIDTYTGATTVANGTTLTFGTSNVLGSNSAYLTNVTMGTGGLTDIIDLAGTTQTIGTLTSSSTNNSGGTITSTAAGGSLTINVGNSSNGNVFGGTVFTNSSSGSLALTISGTDGGSAGNNIQMLNTADNYSGGLTIKSSNSSSETTANLALAGGVTNEVTQGLRTNAAAPLGTGPITLDNGRLYVIASVNVTNTINITSRGGTLHMEGTGGVTQGIEGNGYNGTINNSGGLLVVNSNSGNNNTISMWGSMANFTGTMAIDTTNIGGIALGGSNTGSMNANLLWFGDGTNGGTGKVQWNGVGSATISFGELSNLNSGSGSTMSGILSDNVASTTATFSIGNNTSDTPTFQGTIINGNGTVAFTKVGTDTQTLSATNTYTGATNVSSGTLIITGSSAAGTTSTVYSGATLNANGSGIINGPVTVNGGGKLGGTGTVSGLITLAAGTTSATQGQINLVGEGASTFNISNSAGLTLGGTGSNAAAIDMDATSKIAITNTLTVNAGGASIYISPGTAAANTNYTLMTFASGTGTGFVTGSGNTTQGAITLADPSISFGVSGTLNVSSTAITLVTTGATAPTNAYWSGTQGIHWTDNSSGNGNFTTNLSGGVFVNALPAVSTNVYFAGTGATNLTTNVTGQAFDINSLTYLSTTGAVATTVTSTLQIESGGITQNNSAGSTISGGTVVLGSTQTWTNNTTTPLTITSAVSGSAGLTIVGPVNLGGSSFTSGTLTVNGALNVEGTSISTGNFNGSGSITNTGSANATLTTNITSAQVYSGTLSDGGTGKTLSLLKTGTSSLTLSGPNSYTGTTVVSAGTIVLGNSTALGTSAVTVDNAATLDLGGQMITNSLTLNGVGATGEGGSLINSNTSSTGLVNADILLSPNFTVGGVGNITLQRVQSTTTFTLTDVSTGTLTLGTASTTNQNNLLNLVVSGGGTVLLNMPANYIAVDRGLTLTNGTVQLTGTSNDEFTNGNAINISGGTLDFDGHTITAGIGWLVGTGGTVTNTAASTTSTILMTTTTTNTYAGTITDGAGSGVIAIAITGTGGVETLSGNNNYSGGTNVSGGSTLVMGSATALGTVAAPLMVNAATLDLDGHNLCVTTFSGNSATGIITSNSNTGATATLTVNSSTSATYSGAINNSTTATPDILALVKNGNSTLSLSASSTYSGGTTINNGTISVGAAGAIGSGSVTLGDGSSANSATLLLAGAGYNLSNPVIVAAGGTGTYSIVSNTNVDFTFTGPFTLNNNLTITDTQPHAVFLDGAITSGGSTSNITVTGGSYTGLGNNFIALQGTDTAFTGNLYIESNGYLKTHTGALTAANTVIMDNTARLDTGAVSLTIAGLQDLVTGAGGSTVVNAGTTSNLNLAGSGTYSFSGVISNSGYLTKSGTGTQTLAGSNTYTGATIVSGGTLIAGATNALSPSSAMNVSTGTLNVSGYVNTVASLIVGAGGTLDLGFGHVLTSTGAANLVGTLNLSGTVGTMPETLMTYSSETGSFTTTTGIPTGDKLAYTTTALEIITAGPANLTWDNAGGSGNGTSWDTTSQNWNNGSAATTFSNTSNTSNGDNVTFNDSNNAHYNVIVTSSGVTPNTITVNTAATYNFSGGSIGGGGGLTLTAGTLNVANTTQNAWGSTTVNGGTLILANNTALPINQTLTIASGATVQVTSHSGGPSNVTVLQVGTLNNSGTLNLTNNSLAIVSGSTVGSITTQVAAAYNGGSWTGTSSTGGVITSTTAAADTTYLTAVGVATGLTSFDGITVPSTDILVKYTYYGDTNLDGAVDGSDYTNIDNGFNNHLTGWQNGDFNYDSIVDGSDYTLIDNAYNMQGNSYGTNSAALIASATAQIAGGSSAVPEPTTLGMLGIGAVGLLARRKRKHSGN